MGEEEKLLGVGVGAGVLQIDRCSVEMSNVKVSFVLLLRPVCLVNVKESVSFL